jgi:N-acyl-D-aspartate/D-glutamate deacylase
MFRKREAQLAVAGQIGAIAGVHQLDRADAIIKPSNLARENMPTGVIWFQASVDQLQKILARIRSIAGVEKISTDMTSEEAARSDLTPSQRELLRRNPRARFK